MVTHGNKPHADEFYRNKRQMSGGSPIVWVYFYTIASCIWKDLKEG